MKGRGGLVSAIVTRVRGGWFAETPARGGGWHQDRGECLQPPGDKLRPRGNAGDGAGGGNGALAGAGTADFALVPELTALLPVCRVSRLLVRAPRDIGGRQVPRAYKEAMAAVVSQGNRCPFCVEAHEMFLRGLAGAGIARAVELGDLDRLADPKLQALLLWARATRSPGAVPLLRPPFGPQEGAEIIGTAVLFHYIHRVVLTFLDDSPFPKALRPARGVLRRLGGVLSPWILPATAPPGSSLGLLPEQPLPADLRWARPVTTLASAWSRFAAVAGQAAERLLTPQARARLEDLLAKWQGQDPPLDNLWVRAACEGLPERARAEAQLCVLAALAPYRVDETSIVAFRVHHEGDASLVAAVAWASLAAAGRIGQWLTPAWSIAADMPGE
ncbi:MAG: hypothetical protein KatS3mg077_3234 [Candidatus Binatia bacterium]|nr:MAG: hypothetical protein KatS3mg077_3234 [Candidatus Binatia bacterium]